jgi:hypothetical protein
MRKSSNHGCQGIADSLDNGGRIEAIIIDFSKALDLVSHDQLLTKIAVSGWTRG